MRLERDFFTRPTLEVAQDLLGKVLVFNHYQVEINETEAYIGQDDPACHAARGLTPRTAPMFKIGGHSYVYLIYGMYYCFNVVTETQDYPAAVLIRGGRLLPALPSPQDLQPSPQMILNGPGKLCRFLNITKAQNNLDLTTEPNFFIQNGANLRYNYDTTPRIGIKTGVDKLWRFVVTYS